MSAVAEFHKIAKSKIPELEYAAKPRKRLFRRAEDRYFDFLEKESEKVGEYSWSGYVYATLLPFLDEKGIHLMRSDFDELGAALTDARNATHFVFTSDHRHQYQAALDLNNFSRDELQRFYQQFNEDEWPQAGEAMLDGILALRKCLESVDDQSVIIFSIL